MYRTASHTFKKGKAINFFSQLISWAKRTCNLPPYLLSSSVTCNGQSSFPSLLAENGAMQWAIPQFYKVAARQFLRFAIGHVWVSKLLRCVTLNAGPRRLSHRLKMSYRLVFPNWTVLALKGALISTCRNFRATHNELKGVHKGFTKVQASGPHPSGNLNNDSKIGKIPLHTTIDQHS